MHEDKVQRYKSVKQDIAAVQNEIKTLNTQIFQVSNDITNYVNANRLFEALMNASEISRYATKPKPAKVELNDEHREIIAKKVNELQPLKEKMKELGKQQQILEHQLFDMRVDISEELNEIFDLKESIRQTEDKSIHLQYQSNWLTDYLSEKVNERKLLNQTKNQAEQAFAVLKDRAETNTTLTGGRLDLEKSIISLQDQYNNLRSEIDELNSAIEEEKQAKRAAKEENERQKQEHSEAVNWRTEKEELKQELADLNEQIAQQKKEVQGKEKKASRENSQFERYAPLVKKWALKLNSTEVPEESVSALYEKLNEAKEKKKQEAKEKHNKMTQLVVSNSRLEKEVNRKRKALDRVVEQFHTDEAQMKQSIDDKKTSFEQEEQRLLQQIDDAKLKLAQKYLQAK